MDPAILNLPAIFDPIINYLADTLPPPLYAFTLKLLSHCLVLISALFNLLASLLSRSPLDWDAQTVLPPLIALLAAYWTLVSIYRTTTWVVRTGFWFMKWGIILSALAAGTGWYLGTAQAQDGGLMNTSLVSYISNIALDMMNGRTSGPLGDDGTRHTRSRNTRPKPWESFNRHQEWQYSEDQAKTNENSDLETLMNSLIGVAGRAFGSDSWWMALKGGADGVGSQTGQDTEGSAGGRGSGGTSSKSRSR
ncbi:hypothetical protein P691DRAFT_797015 [Macrolepiota fuliginosa MF-IS2]|uniref:Uncharacterized protein n=1 Tax=Macrolepiota fuliginosa MF-IS2 TaxID=1400762 RepID=A0A9P6C7M1_9AGAR|nr:hypothetical protein P691DRAFT_797015 [Macrolepiota fuliginosa MF-IS2]